VGFFLYQDCAVFDSSQFTFFLIGCIASLALLTLVFQQLFKPRQKFFPKRVITHFESKMFIRLKEAFPQHHILAQVAFSALITNNNFKIRNQFNRKVTDFVLLNQKLEVVAIIELDDPSHIGKEQEDAERDAMLHEAGYQVYRYTDIPSVHSLKKDILN
jgi:very-short-patch-repair endonuclease